jgi:tetratricopeptide (TPR) repeat protein
VASRLLSSRADPPDDALLSKMILTNCAACAATLPHKAKQCSRCKTRYCGPACQKQHWDAAGGHKDLCKLIKKGGGAEEYHADKKYKEAVAVAAEKYADDTKGQTCFICTQALHWKTKEGLVRGCSCRGTAGVVHVSCLVEQAKILVAEGEENNLDYEAMQPRWDRWTQCSLCEQSYHSVVRCALGWACWKTFVGRPEMDPTRQLALCLLGKGLSAGGHYEDALVVQEAELATGRRVGTSENANHMLTVKSNLAKTYQSLDRSEEALSLRQEVYSRTLKLHGKEHGRTLQAASNYVSSLIGLKRFQQAKKLLRKSIPAARRVLGESNQITLHLRCNYAQSLCCNAAATLPELREAVTTFEDVERIARRVLGGAHPFTTGVEDSLRKLRDALTTRETPSGSA